MCIHNCFVRDKVLHNVYVFRHGHNCGGKVMFSALFIAVSSPSQLKGMKTLLFLSNLIFG